MHFEEPRGVQQYIVSLTNSIHCMRRRLPPYPEYHIQLPLVFGANISQTMQDPEDGAMIHGLFYVK